MEGLLFKEGRKEFLILSPSTIKEGRKEGRKEGSEVKEVKEGSEVK
jgi:hypothetical protein